MGAQAPGPLCGSQLGPDWIDPGTTTATRTLPPGCAGLAAPNPDMLQGSAWRTVYLLEYGGTYRLLYAAEAAEIAALKGTLPKEALERLRGQLKSKYQKLTPPEVEALLRAYVGGKYDLRTPTGTSNPGKTNATINQVAGVAKYAGRVLVVVMVASELYKIKTADDWKRQLGSSSGGLLGAVTLGWGGGALAGLAVGGRSMNPWVAAGATLVGGIAGGTVGYAVFSGLFEHIYDVYVVA